MEILKSSWNPKMRCDSRIKKIKNKIKNLFRTKYSVHNVNNTLKYDWEFCGIFRIVLLLLTNLRNWNWQLLKMNYGLSKLFEFCCPSYPSNFDPKLGYVKPNTLYSLLVNFHKF